jgi:hypothetical protein
MLIGGLMKSENEKESEVHDKQNLYVVAVPL